MNTVFAAIFLFLMYAPLGPALLTPHISNYPIFAFVTIWGAHLSLFIVEAISITYIILNWARTVYFLRGTKLIIFHGIFQLHESIYELKHIHAIKMRQTLFGKICNYGSIQIMLEDYAHEGKGIYLQHIPSPKKYERILQQSLSEDAPQKIEELLD